MNDLFKKDLKIKILSIFVALILWLYVYNTQDNPYNSKTFNNISVKIENEASLAEKGLEVKNNYKKSIDITIRGRQDALDKVRDSDFEASIDFSKVNSVNDTSITIIGPVCSQKDVTITEFNPDKIDLVLTRIKGNTFPIEIIPNVTLKQGYKILKITPNQETVTLEGEESLIDSVASVSAALDIKDLDRDTTKRVNCKVIDKNGKEISALSKNLSVEVKVLVAKEVPVVLVVNGTPNKEFFEVQQTVVPDRVRITGAPEKLAGISEILTLPININNIKENINTTGIMNLPEGIKLADLPKEVSISITVEALAVKSVNISKNDIGIKNNILDNTMNYEIKTDPVSLQLKGRSSALNLLDIKSLNPTIDLQGLSEGIHKIPLGITLPSQVTLLQEALIEVKVIKKTEPGAP